ncbi:MAG: hypothetical protein AB1898_29620 [Acidobacteriota bacterium]
MKSLKRMMFAVRTLIAFVALISTTSAQRPAGPVGGEGMPGQIPLWLDSRTLGSSSVSQSSGGIVFFNSGLFAGSNTVTDNTAAILGHKMGNTGLTVGVQGISSSFDGWGVKGVANGANGVGVEGASPNVGLRGNSLVCDNNGCTFTPGDAGQFVTGSGGNLLHGFLGIANQPGGWVEKFRVDSSGSAFFAGDLNVTGNLTKGSGSFTIDHPLDPITKKLSHSFVESPEMMNIYNGNIVTDAQGLASVVLPSYFEALNRDFRYQLTVIGEFAAAMVAKEIENNRFIIKTDKPAVKVSWQVTGIRQDAYANAHRIKVEEEKPASERGHYLHPEVFGASQHKLIGEMEPLPILNGEYGAK